MLRKLTENMEQRLELINSKFNIENFKEYLTSGDPEDLAYFFKLGEFFQEASSEKMEIYILENYEKVPLSIWNSKTFTMTPHIGKDEIRFGKKDEFINNWRIESMAKRAKERWESSIKITEISFTLDEIDGDFSVDFNDGTWCFIDGQEVLEYYCVIKSYLDKLNDV